MGSIKCCLVAFIWLLLLFPPILRCTKTKKETVCSLHPSHRTLMLVLGCKSNNHPIQSKVRSGVEFTPAVEVTIREIMTAAEGNHPKIEENIQNALAFLRRVPSDAAIIASQIPENVKRFTKDLVPYLFTFKREDYTKKGGYEFFPNDYVSKADSSNFTKNDLKNFYAWMQYHGIYRNSDTEEQLTKTPSVVPTPSLIVATELLRLTDEIAENL